MKLQKEIENEFWSNKNEKRAANLEEITSEMAEEVENNLSNHWIVNTELNAITTESQKLSVCGYIEQSQDNSLTIKGYRICEYAGDDVPFLQYFGETTEKQSAIDSLVNFCEHQNRNPEKQTISENQYVSLEKLGKIVANSDTMFAAVTEEHLAQGFFRLLYCETPGPEEEALVLRRLNEYDIVIIDNQPFLLDVTPILPNQIHYYRRIPLYHNPDSYGGNEVPINEGIVQVREFIKTGINPTPPASEITSANELIQELVNAGAVAIAVEPNVSSEETLTFKTWMPPAVGYDIVGEYAEIAVNNQTFELNWEFCIDGPNFFNRLPVYADENITGMAPVSPEEGFENLKRYVNSDCLSGVGNVDLDGLNGRRDY